MRAIPVLAALVLLAACDDPHAGHKHGPGDGHDHGKPTPTATKKEEDHAHHHEAPHGGLLVVLKEESFNAELLVDPAEGRLTVWFLDGHAENPRKVNASSIQVAVWGLKEPAEVVISLPAVANALTGETADSSSQFSAAHPVLKGAAKFQGRIAQVKDAKAGWEYKDVAFSYPGK